MTGSLTPQEIEQLLQLQMTGRIACCSGNIPYIVPISYAYDGKDLYFHTYQGKKIDIMRNNPEVCFQADHMHSMADWRSVIAWGRFEEITIPPQREAALRLLVSRTLPLISSVTTHLGKSWPFMQDSLSDDIPGIVFCIRLREKTGRFENNAQDTAMAG